MTAGARAAALDAALGDPCTADAAISFGRSVALDEAAAFPQEEFDAVVAAGLQADYVPAEHGGQLVDLLSPLLAVRAVARRDLTAAVAHGKTFLGAVCPWTAPGDLAHEVVAPMVLAGESVSWGLTEQGRGSDLLATRTTARPDGRSWVLEGEKWLINNATRGRAMTVLARTSDDPGPRSLSLFFVDKAEVGRDRLRAREKVATHGIRGADISGLGFSRALVPPGRMVGEPGEGLEIVLKGLQVTRTLCTALSLGAADTVVQASVRLADERRLYGRTLADLPAARETLADAVCDLAVAETVALAGARHLQLLPEESALVSPVVKYLVTHLTDRMLRTLTRFAGARGVLVDGPYGHVQKAVRDNRVVGIFDGNSLVNLHAVINEFTAIGRHRDEPDPLPGGLFSQARCATPWTPGRLRLRTRSGARLVRHLPVLAQRGEHLLGPAGRAVAATLVRRSADLTAGAGRLSPQRHPDPDRYRTAHEYAVVLAAATLLGVAADDDAPGAFWSGEGRLDRGLVRLARMLDPTRLDGGRPAYGREAAHAVDGLVDVARTAAAGGAVGMLAGGGAR
ncbi:acyl-CoA dehydrogenase [Myceligenerans halotolerans]